MLVIRICQREATWCCLYVKSYVCVGKNSIYKFQYYPWFQASNSNLEVYPSWIRGDCGIRELITLLMSD